MLIVLDRVNTKYIIPKHWIFITTFINQDKKQIDMKDLKLLIFIAGLAVTVYTLFFM